jgi:hypothetical protein
MKRTIIPGPIAIAASVLGATEEMAKPIADAQKDSIIIAEENFKNFGTVGCNRVIG